MISILPKLSADEFSSGTSLSTPAMGNQKVFPPLGLGAASAGVGAVGGNNTAAASTSFFKNRPLSLNDVLSMCGREGKVFGHLLTADGTAYAVPSINNSNNCDNHSNGPTSFSGDGETVGRRPSEREKSTSGATKDLSYSSPAAAAPLKGFGDVPNSTGSFLPTFGGGGEAFLSSVPPTPQTVTAVGNEIAGCGGGGGAPTWASVHIGDNVAIPDGSIEEGEDGDYQTTPTKNNTNNVTAVQLIPAPVLPPTSEELTAKPLYALRDYLHKVALLLQYPSYYDTINHDIVHTAAYLAAFPTVCGTHVKHRHCPHVIGADRSINKNTASTNENATAAKDGAMLGDMANRRGEGRQGGRNGRARGARATRTGGRKLEKELQQQRRRVPTINGGGGVDNHNNTSSDEDNDGGWGGGNRRVADISSESDSDWDNNNSDDSSSSFMTSSDDHTSSSDDNDHSASSSDDETGTTAASGGNTGETAAHVASSSSHAADLYMNTTAHIRLPPKPTDKEGRKRYLKMLRKVNPALRQHSEPFLPNTQMMDIEDVRRLPRYAQSRRVHNAAVEGGYDCYRDLYNGCVVFCKPFLAQVPCCGQRCKHCPYGHHPLAFSPQQAVVVMREELDRLQQQQQQQQLLSKSGAAVGTVASSDELAGNTTNNGLPAIQIGGDTSSGIPKMAALDRTPPNDGNSGPSGTPLLTPTSANSHDVLPTTSASGAVVAPTSPSPALISAPAIMGGFASTSALAFTASRGGGAVPRPGGGVGVGVGFNPSPVNSPSASAQQLTTQSATTFRVVDTRRPFQPQQISTTAPSQAAAATSSTASPTGGSSPTEPLTSAAVSAKNNNNNTDTISPKGVVSPAGKPAKSTPTNGLTSISFDGTAAAGGAEAHPFTASNSSNSSTLRQQQTASVLAQWARGGFGGIQFRQSCRKGAQQQHHADPSNTFASSDDVTASPAMRSGDDVADGVATAHVDDNGCEEGGGGGHYYCASPAQQDKAATVATTPSSPLVQHASSSPSSSSPTLAAGSGSAVVAAGPPGLSGAAAAPHPPNGLSSRVMSLHDLSALVLADDDEDGEGSNAEDDDDDDDEEEEYEEDDEEDEEEEEEEGDE